MSQDRELGIGGVEKLPNVYEKHGTQDFVEWYKQQAEFVGANVVDIGCGAGHPFTGFMAELCTYIGVEKDLTLSDSLTQSSITNGWPNVQSAHADVEKEGDQFSIIAEAHRFCHPKVDYVVSNFSMVYMERVHEIFALAAHLLKDGGEFLITGYGDGNNKELYDLQMKAIGSIPDSDKDGFNTVSSYAKLASHYFEHHEIRKFQNKLVFNTAGPFVNYYMNTVTAEETIKQGGSMADNVGKYMFREATKAKKPIIVTKNVELLVCKGVKDSE